MSCSIFPLCLGLILGEKDGGYKQGEIPSCRNTISNIKRIRRISGHRCHRPQERFTSSETYQCKSSTEYRVQVRKVSLLISDQRTTVTIVSTSKNSSSDV